MIYEYALDPELVATWGELKNCRFFAREFGLGQGKIVSRYPKSWAKKVWGSFNGTNDIERKRLEELLTRLQETTIKRKNYLYDEMHATWLENALVEHSRHPFRAIMTRDNHENRPEVIGEHELSSTPHPRWDTPHGITVNRRAPEMAAALRSMLYCCRWVQFIDPYFSKAKQNHKQSLSAYLNVIGSERPVGPIERVEVHCRADGASSDFLKSFYQEIVPCDMTVTIFQWHEKPYGQAMHNRYILTDLAGVSFNHGLDIGGAGETDDINLLDRSQYVLRCKQYNTIYPAFDQVVPPIEIIGMRP